MPLCGDIAVGLGCHVEGNCLHGGSLCAVALHDLLERSKLCNDLAFTADVQMIDVALVGDIRVNCKDDIGLEDTHTHCHGGTELLDVVEATVAEIQEVDIIHSQDLGAGDGLFLSNLDQFLRRGSLGCVPKSVAAVKADQERDFLAHGGQL